MAAELSLLADSAAELRILLPRKDRDVESQSRCQKTGPKVRCEMNGDFRLRTVIEFYRGAGRRTYA